MVPLIRKRAARRVIRRRVRLILVDTDVYYINLAIITSGFPVMRKSLYYARQVGCLTGSQNFYRITPALYLLQFKTNEVEYFETGGD